MRITAWIKDNKAFSILIAVELAVIIFFTARLFKADKSYVYLPDSFVVQNGTVSDSACSIDQDGVLDFFYLDYLSLPTGDYDVELSYYAESEGHICFAEIEDNVSGFLEETYNQLNSNTLRLTSGKSKETLHITLNRATDYLRIRLITVGGELDVYSVTLKETHRDEVRNLTSVLAVVLLADLLIIWAGRRRRTPDSPQQKLVIVGLAGIIFMSSLCILVPYLVEGHDLSFHLLRIEGVKDAILTGQLPAKIQPNWLNGNGYAVSVFYGDLFLYIPALLRILGYSIWFSYSAYVLLVNTATCLIAYACFKGMSGSRRAALLGSAIYTLSIYRLTNLYIRSAVGEYSAMTFFPLIVYGLWKIFTEDVNDSRYKYNFILPVIGYTGLIQTHVISCEIAGIVTIAMCIVFVRKLFCLRRFAVLALVVVLTAVVNSGFLIPFISYMDEKVLINSGQRYKDGIQYYGAFFAQIFEFFTSYEGLTVTAESGIAGEMPSTAGWGVMLGGALFACQLYLGRADKKLKKAGIFCLAAGCAAIWMSTVHFPWDQIQTWAGICAKVITSIQFPWRFLTAAVVLLSVAAVAAFTSVFKSGDGKAACAAYIITITAVVQAVWLMSGILNSAEPLWAYDEAALDNSFVVGGEYLPVGQNAQHYKITFSTGSDNISYEELDRNLNKIRFTCENASGEDGWIATSLVYYTGYQAENTATGETLGCYEVDGYTCVRVPAGTSGEYVLRYEQPLGWRIAYIISFAGAAFLAAAMLAARRETRNVCSGKIKKSDTADLTDRAGTCGRTDL